jgi:L-alanine-DL-glutamate epimerase-like enolase superfamily enzyme
MTGLNMAACIHFLAAIDNSGYFEADVLEVQSLSRPARERVLQIGQDGCVLPQEKPGLGVEVDEGFLTAHPVIEGPGYV